mgnify:CR=1 FL=1
MKGGVMYLSLVLSAHCSFSDRIDLEKIIKERFNAEKEIETKEHGNTVWILSGQDNDINALKRFIVTCKLIQQSCQTGHRTKKDNSKRIISY